MRKTVKVVNGYEISKLNECHGHYTVAIAPNKFVTFRTIKAATAYCIAQK